jgi:hypothetical protein
MARRPPRTFTELAIGVVGAILTTAIMYFGATHILKRMHLQTQESLTKIQQGIIAKHPQAKAPSSPQAPDPYAAQVAQAAAMSKQRHDEAWSIYYKPQQGCDNWESDAHMVKCVNHKMRAKEEFERKWAAGDFDTPQG